MAILKQAPSVVARGRTVVWCLLALYVLVHVAGVLLGDRLMAVAGILGVGSLAAVLWAMGGFAHTARPSRDGLLAPPVQPPTQSAIPEGQLAADEDSSVLPATGDPHSGSNDKGGDQAAQSTDPVEEMAGIGG